MGGCKRFLFTPTHPSPIKGEGLNKICFITHHGFVITGLLRRVKPLLAMTAKTHDTKKMRPHHEKQIQ